MGRAASAFLALFVLLALPASAQTPKEQLAQPPANAERWVIFSAAGPHGQSLRWTAPDGARWSRESLLLRGFVTEIDQELRFANGALVRQVVRGSVPEGDAAETFAVANGRYNFRSSVDHGEGAARAGVFYSSYGGTIDSTIALTDALRAAPNHTLDLLPSGRATLEQLTTLEIRNARGERKTVTCYAVTGLGLSPNLIWYEGDRFFAVVDFLSVMPEGWEGANEAMSTAQDAALAARSRNLVDQVAPRVRHAVVFQNVRLFDSEALTFRDNMTVVVTDGRIASVTPAASAPPLPARAEVFQGAGRTLLPGLWDSHMHYGDDFTGPLILAQGITSARDPGNRPESRARRQRVENGELLGTRIIASQIIDGRGPLAAQSAATVTNRTEAIAAIRRAKTEGYFGVKLYGSLNPSLVPILAREAHRLGLRVHGHIPAGMRPLEAVRAGYDEITHINFVAMQAMPDAVIRESNGLQRFYGPGRYAGAVDWNSPPMRAYLDELQRRRIAVDPTLSVYEAIFVPDQGEMSAVYAPLEGTLPPQLERGFRSGGLAATPEVSRAQMRAAFQSLSRLVAELKRRNITIVAGTDGYGIELVRELELYVAAGMTPAEALATATIVPSRTFGVAAETGSITVGKKAELFLVAGDPSRNIGDLRQVEIVMRDGRLMDANDLRRVVGISGPPRRANPPG